MGTSFMKFRLFFHKVSLIISTLSPPLHMTLHAGHENLELSAEASELFTHTVLHLTIIYKIASSDCIFQGAKKVEVRGCKIMIVGRMWENSQHNCCNCLPCAQTGVGSGTVMLDLTHPHVWPHPSNSLC